MAQLMRQAATPRVGSSPLPSRTGNSSRDVGLLRDVPMGGIARPIAINETRS